jgi:hypothetical protein
VEAKVNIVKDKSETPRLSKSWGLVAGPAKFEKEKI